MPASTIGQSVLQGLKSRAELDRQALIQRQEEEKRQNREELKNLTKAAQQGGVGSEAFGDLAAFSPDQATKLKSVLRTDDQGLEAAFQDAAVTRSLIENDPTGVQASAFLQNRVQVGQSQGRDMFLSQNLLQSINQNPLAAVDEIDRFLTIPDQLRSQQQGLTAGQKEFASLTEGLTPAQKKSAKLKKLGLESRVSSKVFDIGGVPHVVDNVGNVRRITIDGNQVDVGSVAQSKADIQTAVTTAKGEAEIPTDLRKLVQASNVKRLQTLRPEKKKRASTVKKARDFLDAFQNKGAESGASRTGLGFVPGVFSNQAVFDERFNSFAEVAARAKLKANGETRPTDNDVEGMKRAIFGVGRDEATNIQLLQEFISDIQDQDVELDELIEARKTGQLDTFTGALEQPLTPEEQAELQQREVQFGNR